MERLATRDGTSLYSCVCDHAGMWHKPECRIPNCDCQAFQHATVSTEQARTDLWPQARMLSSG